VISVCVNVIPAEVHLLYSVIVVWACRCFCPKYPFDLFETYEVTVICHFLSDAPQRVSCLMFFVRRCEGSLLSPPHVKPSVHLSMVVVL
jgi:hypothetical protein